MSDKRPELYVHTDHNPDDVRVFYELPDALVERIRPPEDGRTFAQALADIVAVWLGAIDDSTTTRACHPAGATYCRQCGYPL